MTALEDYESRAKAAAEKAERAANDALLALTATKRTHGLFRRCKHNWKIVGRRSYGLMEKGIFDLTWEDAGTETAIYYICTECNKDKQRTVDGTFTIEQARAVFPQP